MTLTRLSFAVAIAAGCSSNHHEKPDAQIDAHPDATPDAPPLNIVTVDTAGETPIFLAYRDGAGPWQTIDPASNTYELHVTDAFTFVAVCGDSTNGFDVGYQGQTFSADGPTVSLPCFGFGTTTGTPVSVKGTMVQAGTVSMGDTAQSTTPNWSFDLSVVPGTHELVALGTNNRVLIRRNQNITVATTLPAVDVVAAGTPMVSVPVTVTGAQSNETVKTRVTWFTGDDFMLFPSGAATTALVVPDALIQPTDSHRLRVSAVTATTDRFQSERYMSGASTAFDLPPRLSNVTVAADHATWTGTLPDGTSEFYTESSVANVFADAHISGTPSWLGTQTTYAIDYAIPGFQPEWKVDFATADFSDVDIFSVVAGKVSFTEAFIASPAAGVKSAAQDAGSCRGHRRCPDRPAGR